MHASMVLLQSLSDTAHPARRKAETLAATAKAVIATTTDIEAADTDLDDLARDQISAVVSGRFKGHGSTRLAEGILKAQGYATYRSPEGADGGAYILAGSGPLGFSAPRLCVEVKSEDSPIGREPVDKLLGTITKFNADKGLFVASEGSRATCRKSWPRSSFGYVWGRRRNCLNNCSSNTSDWTKTSRPNCH